MFVLQPSRCVNQIEDVCKDIEKTINQTVQNTLNSLEKDCERIASLIDAKLQADRYQQQHAHRALLVLTAAACDVQYM